MKQVTDKDWQNLFDLALKNTNKNKRYLDETSIKKTTLELYGITNTDNNGVYDFIYGIDIIYNEYKELDVLFFKTARQKTYIKNFKNINWITKEEFESIIQEQKNHIKELENEIEMEQLKVFEKVFLPKEQIKETILIKKQSPLDKFKTYFKFFK